MKLPNRVINEREVTCAMDGRGERQRGKGGGGNIWQPHLGCGNPTVVSLNANGSA